MLGIIETIEFSSHLDQLSLAVEVSLQLQPGLLLLLFPGPFLLLESSLFGLQLFLLLLR